MSTYTATEAALLAVLHATGMSAINSARGDYGILNNEGVTQAVVLQQAARSEFGDNLGQGRGTHGKRQQRHHIAMTVFQARGQENDGISYVALTTLTDSLIAILDTYPGLNGASGVKRAEVVEMSEPRINRDRAWLYQIVLVDVLTETSPELTEPIR